jgi:carboxylesterase
VAIVRRELRRIHQPTLIVHPRHDDRASLGSRQPRQRRLSAGYTRRNVETCVLDDSYHVITVDRQRDIVVERRAAFAKRLVETHGGHGRHDCIEIFDLYQPSASSNAS